METCMKDVIWFKIRKREIYIFIKLVKSIWKRMDKRKRRRKGKRKRKRKRNV
jgi:hypothetical protein